METRIDESAPIRYELDRALLLYRAAQDMTVTLHEVVQGPQGLRLGPATFVTRSFIRKLLDLLGRTPLTYIPANVIAVSRTAVAWYEPASVQPMYFTENDDTSVLAFSGTMVPQPPLLFVAHNRALSVYALNEDARPSPTTKLYKAPYWNIFAHDVCTGSMVIPKSVDPRSTGAWTKAFFGSNFTHLSGGKRWRRPGTYSELLAAAVAAKRFDPGWLDPLDMTVEQAVVCGK